MRRAASLLAGGEAGSDSEAKLELATPVAVVLVCKDELFGDSAEVARLGETRREVARGGMRGESDGVLIGTGGVGGGVPPAGISIGPRTRPSPDDGDAAAPIPAIGGRGAAGRSGSALVSGR